jgi:hypothetical protein
MKRTSWFPILLVALLANVCRGEDIALCKADCDAEKRECRGMAGTLSRDDTSPILSMGEKNPYALSQREPGVVSDLRPDRQDDYRNRRSERLRKCDDRYLRCTRDCSDPAATSSTSSVLINRKKKERERLDPGATVDGTRPRDSEKTGEK